MWGLRALSVIFTLVVQLHTIQPALAKPISLHRGQHRAIVDGRYDSIIERSKPPETTGEGPAPESNSGESTSNSSFPAPNPAADTAGPDAQGTGGGACSGDTWRCSGQTLEREWQSVVYLYVRAISLTSIPDSEAGLLAAYMITDWSQAVRMESG